MAKISLIVNGNPVNANIDPRTLLVQFLRENLHLTGTHVGCDTSQCGACVVHIDGKAVKSCTTLAVMADGHEVRTIEGLAIDGGPLDTILSMRGVVIGGVYRAAIGSRAVLHGELIGREMGMSTWVSFAGTNDHALAHGEFAETPDGLKTLLKALRSKGLNIISIRNHTLGEHPQFVFVRFWGQDSALELAKKIRYVLDTQVGAMAPTPREKI